MKLNPEFLRNVRIQLTPRRVAFAAGLTITLIIIGSVLVWFGTDPYSYLGFGERLHRFGQVSFGLLVFAQFALLHVMATGAAGGSLVQERMRGTLVFQQMTLLSPHEMLLGKLFGSSIMYYFLAAIIAPFAIISALLGQVPLADLLNIYALLIVGGLCWQAIGIFISAVIAGSMEAAGRTLTGMGHSIGGVAGVISLSTTSATLALRQETIHFYGMPLPGFPVMLGLMIFVGGWAYAGAVRAFKGMQLIPLSPRPIWGFFASLEALLVGLLWNGYLIVNSDSIYPNYRCASFHDGLIGQVVLYLSINWIALTALAGAAAIGRNQLREWWSAERDTISVLKRTEIRNAMLSYPIAVGISIIGLTVLWLSLRARESVCAAAGGEWGFSAALLVVSALAFLATMAAMAGFIQFWAMHRFRVANQAGIVLWVLFFIVMGIAAAIMGRESFAALINPLVLTPLVLDKPDSLSLITTGLVTEFGFAACCLGLAFGKWRRTHSEMLSR